VRKYTKGYPCLALLIISLETGSSGIPTNPPKALFAEVGSL